MTALGVLLGQRNPLRRRRQSSGGTRRAVTFPATRLKTRVQIALGADLAADPLTWPWADITAPAPERPGGYVRQDLGISLTVGRRDEASTVTTGTAQLKLDNRDGRFSRRNPTSPYYGLLSKNTPIWVTVDAGSGEKTRLEMFVNEWPTRWSDLSATDSTVTIQCAGILRRLAQGAVLKSALRRANLALSPIAYWPMEDGDASASAGSALPGGEPMPLDAPPTFVAGSAGSAGALDLVAASPSFTLGRVTLASTTGFQLEFAAVSDQGLPTLIVQIDALSSGAFVSTGLLTANADGDWHHRAIQVVQNGSDVDFHAYVDGVFSSTTTVTGVTIKSNVSLRFFVGEFSTGTVAVSHLVVFGSTSGSSDRVSAMNGYPGEQAHVRMIRLAGEERVLFATTAGRTAAMGPQGTTTFIDQMRQCEAADGGVLYEKRWGLAYKSLDEYYNQPVGLALDFDQGHIGDLPEPADDDQRLRNKWTVSRTNGSESTAEQTTGPLGTGAEGPGLYDDSVTLNLGGDSQLEDQANWRLHKGQVDEDRWPAIGLNFAASPELIDAVTALGYGARITVDHPPAQMPPDQLDLIVEGHTERWDPYIWTASLNTSPASPYRIAVVEDPAAVQETPRVGSGTATLAENIGTADMSLSIPTGTGGLWTTDAADFPLDVDIGGERVRLSSISGASSPQTFTVSARSINGVVKAHSAGTRVEAWQIATVGL